MSEATRLQARAEAYRRLETICRLMITWCDEHGVKPDTFYRRAEEAEMQARRAERQLRRMTT